MNILYSKIKELCKVNGITVSELENALEFSRGSIYKWDVNIPSINKVKAVADYFKISVDQLLEGGESNEKGDCSVH